MAILKAPLSAAETSVFLGGTLRDRVPGGAPVICAFMSFVTCYTML